MPSHAVTCRHIPSHAPLQVKAEFPPEWQTTAMLLLNSAISSVGRTAGSLFGGFFIAHGSFLGYTRGRALYAGAAVAAATLIVAHTVVTLALRACGCRGLVETPPPATSALEPLVAPAAPQPPEMGPAVPADEGWEVDGREPRHGGSPSAIN